MWRKIPEKLSKACVTFNERCHQSGREWYIKALGPHYRDMSLMDGAKCSALFAYEKLKGTSPQTKSLLLGLYSIAPYIAVKLKDDRDRYYEKRYRNSSLAQLLNSELPEYFEKNEDHLAMINKAIDEKRSLSDKDRLVALFGTIEGLSLEQMETLFDTQKIFGTCEVPRLQALSQLLKDQQRSLSELNDKVEALIIENKKREN